MLLFPQWIFMTFSECRSHYYGMRFCMYHLYMHLIGAVPVKKIHKHENEEWNLENEHCWVGMGCNKSYVHCPVCFILQIRNACISYTVSSCQLLSNGNGLHGWMGRISEGICNQNKVTVAQCKDKICFS